MPTVTPITNINTIKLIFFMQFLRKDSPSEWVAKPRLTAYPWFKRRGAFGPWRTSLIWCAVGVLGLSSQQGAYKGPPAYDKTFVDYCAFHTYQFQIGRPA